MIRAIIVEDEINSQELLQIMLEEHCDGIEVVGIAADVKSGIEIIKNKLPDVVFLDVEINGGDGFDILNSIDSPTFGVVFVTGYNHYAIKAIKYSALDYILKPVNLIELRKAVARIKKQSISHLESIKFLQANLKKEPEQIDQIIISDDRKHNVVKFDDILFVKSDRTYITFYLKNKRKHVTSNSLNFYESLLPSSLFFRIHKSYLINLKKVINVPSGRGGLVEIVEGFNLPIAFRRKAAFLRELKKSNDFI